MVSERDRFTPAEWRTLQFAPFWLLSTLMGSYNRFDPRAVRVFTRCLDVAAASGGPFTRELFASVVAERDQVAAAYDADGRTIGTGLVAVADLLDRVAPEEADVFKLVLFTEIGEAVARARGPWGEEVSEDDAKTLTLAAVFLAIDPVPDLAQA
jgi:hypothetical protein